MSDAWRTKGAGRRPRPPNGRGVSQPAGVTERISQASGEEIGPERIETSALKVEAAAPTVKPIATGALLSVLAAKETSESHGIPVPPQSETAAEG